MSPIRESKELFYNTQVDTYVMFTKPRQTSNGRRIETAIYGVVQEVWDKKINKDALYASSNEERFKRDVLPEIIKKLQS